MTVQVVNNPNTSSAHNSYYDPAFEPQAGFPFGDMSDKSLRTMQDNIASLNSLNNQGLGIMDSESGVCSDNDLYAGNEGPYPVGTNQFTASSGIASHNHIDPSDVWNTSGNSPVDPPIMGTNGMLLSGVGQNDNLKGRGDSVIQQFGQITPPQDRITPELGDSKISKTSNGARTGQKRKMDTSERARHAANQRHSKPKKARMECEKRENLEECTESKHDEEPQNDGDDVRDKRDEYREKNRLAAAKCRTKKKASIDELEERQRELATTNTLMKHLERELRDELTVWRTMALQHSEQSAGCQCHNVHAYNARKASELAFGWSQPAASTPSEMDSSAPSSMSFEAMRRSHSTPDGTPRMMRMPSRLQSFAAPSNFAFAPVTTPEGFHMSTPTAGAGEQQPFASYLQSSDDSRAGFA